MMIELELPYPPTVNHYWSWIGRGIEGIGDETIKQLTDSLNDYVTDWKGR
jgi:hypothetical protein